MNDFIGYCKSGNLLKYVETIKNFSNINIHVYDECAFRCTYLYNHLHVTKWLG